MPARHRTPSHMLCVIMHGNCFSLRTWLRAYGPHKPLEAVLLATPLAAMPARMCAQCVLDKLSQHRATSHFAPHFESDFEISINRLCMLCKATTGFNWAPDRWCRKIRAAFRFPSRSHVTQSASRRAKWATRCSLIVSSRSSGSALKPSRWCFSFARHSRISSQLICRSPSGYTK